MRFRKNDTITLNETEKIVVKDFLGDGGQGEVYLVEYNGEKYALKVSEENLGKADTVCGKCILRRQQQRKQRCR